MKTPLVSIVITCYNYADFVAEAIESALSQTYKNKEVIVIDDGSTDESLEIIKRYDAEIKVITRSNKGIVYTRNEALRMVTGDFLCFLDADDFFDSDYIEKMVAYATKYKADVVYPNWRVFGDLEYVTDYKDFTLRRLICQEIHCSSESLIRLSAVRGSVFESEVVAEDWDFFLGLALAGKRFKLAKDCYINYRVRSNTRSSQRDYWDDMKYFVDILKKWQKQYPDKVDPMDLPACAGRARDQHIQSQQAILNEQSAALEERARLLSERDTDLQTISNELQALRMAYDSIQKSDAYRLGSLITRPARSARRLQLKTHQKMKSIRRKSYNRVIDARYSSQFQASVSTRRSSTGKFAVVIHLFYTENWPLFLRKLQLLPVDEFDLYITVPKQGADFSEKIKESFPDACIVIAPNRGRDVLPFIKLAEQLQGVGYKSVLKFHSKKSTHREDGQDWLETMLDQIIPDNPVALKKILDIVRTGEYGVLGPADVYYPLTINYPANKQSLRWILESFDIESADDVLADRRKYGFFGGTMFWINLDSVSEIVRYKANRFEEEQGQIDGTFAHALERAFCLLPELKGKVIYQSDGTKVTKRAYQSDNIPDWSTDHDKE